MASIERGREDPQELTSRSVRPEPGGDHYLPLVGGRPLPNDSREGLLDILHDPYESIPVRSTGRPSLEPA